MPSILKPKKNQFQSLTGANTQKPSILQPNTGGFQSLNTAAKPNFQLATGQAIKAPTPNLQSLRASGGQAASLSRPSGSAVLPPAPQNTPKLTQNEQKLVQQPQAPKFTTPSGATGTIEELEALATPTPQPLAVQPTTTPQVAQQPSQAVQQPSQAAQLQSQLQQTFVPSEQETALQQQLNNLLSSSELGIDKIRNQTIAMPFITGQAEAVQRQAATQAAPLQRQLALLQAERQAQQQALQSQLEFEQSQQPETFEVDGNLVRINPQTGQAETIFSAPSAGENKPIKVGDQLVQLNPQTGQYESVFGGGGAGGVEPPIIEKINGVDMKWNPNTGQFEPFESTPPSDYSVERATRTLQSVSELKKDALANPDIFGRTAAAPIPDWARSDAFRNFKAELDTLASNIAFNELTAMREASKTGGALGQVSDREGRLLQSALGALQMSQSPENFVEQLDKIEGSINRWKEAVNAAGGVPNASTETSSVEEFLRQNPSGTYEEYLQTVQQQSFNRVGGDTNQALNRPQRNNNPGNVKRGGVADSLAVGTDEQGHLIFPSAEAGFQALQQDLQAKISGNSRFVNANPTIAELGSVYAEDPNWGNRVAQILGVTPQTRTMDIDFNNLVQAIARQEGFYA